MPVWIHSLRLLQIGYHHTRSSISMMQMMVPQEVEPIGGKTFVARYRAGGGSRDAAPSTVGRYGTMTSTRHEP